MAGPSSYAIKYSLDGQVYTESKPDIIDAGNYVLYCKAETSETGYLSPTIRSAEIVVDPLTVQDDKLIVGKIEAQTFTGDEIRPNLDVKYVIDEPEFSLLRFFKFENGIQELEQDKDYTVSYKNNVEPGTASVNINFIGNYAGETTSNFEIVSSPESKNVASTAQTGDASNIGLIVMVIAIAGAFCALSRKKLWNK